VRPSSRYEADSEGTFYARRAADFLENHRDGPFCLWVSFREPHSPFNFPVEYAGRYDPADMPLPEAGPEDARWMPAEFQDLTDAEKRGIIAAYYTSVEYMDQNVGRVLRALEERGLDENTLVVYAGDHGYLLGHHGRFEKHMMWEEAVRSPLLIRGPGLEPTSTDALTGLVDLAPTILDVLGEPPMPHTQGRSLTPLLEGRTETHRRVVFSEYLPDNKAMVRTDRWKYVFTTGASDLAGGYATGLGPSGIDHRLYDLETDPGETNNLADDPQYSGVLKSMQIQMLERFQRTHPHAEELPPQLSLTGALAWFSMPPDGDRAWFDPPPRTRD
jgi:arylsulfatase A-like enzyme